MKLIYLGGIPHWTDGEMALPIMAGADGWGDVTGGGSENEQEKRDYKAADIGFGPAYDKPEDYLIGGQIIVDGTVYDVRSGAANLKGPYYALGPNNTQIEIPAGTYLTPTGKMITVDRNMKILESRTLSQSEREAAGLSVGSSGLGSGPGSSATIVGVRAPDPSGAAQLLLEYYDRQVQSGMMPWETAMKEFESNLARAQAMNNDIREREIAETSRQLRVAEEAGSRARTVASEILPRSLPNTQNINLPLMGNLPLNQVNVDQLFNQGLPPLAQMQGISQTPATPYPELNLPPIQMPQLPNIQNYVNQTAGGFTGWVM